MQVHSHCPDCPFKSPRTSAIVPVEHNVPSIPWLHLLEAWVYGRRYWLVVQLDEYQQLKALQLLIQMEQLVRLVDIPHPE
jgi:hypothetical protein